MLHAITSLNIEPRFLLDAAALVESFDRATETWHGTGTVDDDLATQLHRANFDLWHLEDRARDPRANDALIAEVKRGIDRTNQQRNDLVEQIDVLLLQALKSTLNHTAPLHSETPGMILDRLSILSLKRFHTNEETSRQDATEQHRARNRERLAILQQQSLALVTCLNALWREICQGTRRFALYRQMKMYNDPTLNPVLYAAGKRSTT